MSKTTTMAQTRNIRGNKDSTLVTSAHHVITIGKGERKPGNEKRYIDKAGYVLDETGKTDRRSSRGNRSTEKVAVPTSKSRQSNQESKQRDSNRKVMQSSAIKSQENRVPDKNKLSIEQFYKNKGMDYSTMRKNCKIKVCDGALIVDTYKPPEGYTAEDLPDSQGCLSQKNNDPISPAVLLASHHRKQKVLSRTPPISDKDLISRIQNVGKRSNKANVLENVAQLSTEPTQPVGANDTFPDDSFNDSDLILASQQVENEYVQGRGVKDAFKRDIKGNSKVQTPTAPFASTPVPASGRRNIAPTKETPRTARSVTRSRNRSNGQNTNKGNNHLDNESLFETSHLDVSNISVDDAAPRKILKFDESPIKSVRVNAIQPADLSRVGDFDDDNQDDIFSQLEIPGEIRQKESVFESSSESARPTSLNDFDSSKSVGEMECQEMDSFLDDDALEALDKLEAVHCTSAGSNSSGTSNNHQKTRHQAPETPRESSRPRGLSRGRKLVAM